MKHLSFLSLLLLLFISSCTKDSGDLTVTFDKATAEYGDISEIRNTPLISAPKAIENQGKIFLGEDFLLIGEEGKGIHVYDNTNPANAVNMLFINLPFTKEFIVNGNFIYAESQYDMVKIDISDPYSPVLLQRLENAFYDLITNDEGQALLGFYYETVTETFKINGRELRELENNPVLFYDYTENLIPNSAVPASFAGNSSGQFGTINRITAVNDYVYAVAKNKMHVFSDNGLMAKANTLNSSDLMETIYPQGEYLYVGGNTAVTIYDNRNPELPIETSSYAHITSCDPVLPNGSVAYVTLRTGDFSNCPGDVNAMEVLNINNPNNPQRITDFEMNSPYGMCIVGDLLYVGEGESGLAKFDISNVSQPIYLGTDSSIKAYDVMPHPTQNDLILTTGPNGIEQYDYNPETFTMSLIGVILM
ncbi:MAG: LVIVD repeat-containing protein [Flavobacteriales bacterium]